jgi:hypothetical protein
MNSNTSNTSNTAAVVFVVIAENEFWDDQRQLAGVFSTLTRAAAAVAEREADPDEAGITYTIETHLLDRSIA